MTPTSILLPLLLVKNEKEKMAASVSETPLFSQEPPRYRMEQGLT